MALSRALAATGSFQSILFYNAVVVWFLTNSSESPQIYLCVHIFNIHTKQAKQKLRSWQEELVHRAGQLSLELCTSYHRGRKQKGIYALEEESIKSWSTVSRREVWNTEVCFPELHHPEQGILPQRRSRVLCPSAAQDNTHMIGKNKITFLL